MTTATTAFTGKSLHAGSKAPAAIKKPVKDERANSKHNVLGTVLRTLNDGLFRSLKSHFDVTYRK